MSRLSAILDNHVRWVETGGTSGARADLRVIATHGSFVTEDFRHVTRRLPASRSEESLLDEIRRRGCRDANLVEALLERANLTDLDFRGSQLRRVQAAEAKFDRSNLEGCDLAGAQLRSTSFAGANLRGCDLTGADLTEAKLSGADLTGAILRNAKLVAADFSGCQAMKSDWTKADLQRADLSRSVIAGSDFTEAILDLCVLSDAVADEATFTRARMCGAVCPRLSLRDAILDFADLRSSRMEKLIAPGLHANSASLHLVNAPGSDFSDADLSSAALCGGNFGDCNFSRAKMRFADLRETTVVVSENGQETAKQRRPVFRGSTWTDADLSWARFDNSTLNEFPTELILHFRHRLNIQGVETMGTKVFICHAREDGEVASEIYDRLAAEGFYPWLDKRNLAPGDAWPREIPLHIQSSNAVIVCLSAIAVSKRGYVQREFRLALDALQEIPPGRTFIIPVRIDECHVPLEFAGFQYVNYWEAESMDRIINVLHSVARSSGVAQPT